MTKASFVLPVKNGGKFIAETVKSLMNQTEKDIEIIIVNDHSTDNTVEIVQKMMQYDQRIKLVHNPKNITGEGATRNFGTKSAVGKIILPTDADDPNKPDRAKISITEIEKNQADIFYGTLEHYFVDTEKRERRFFQPYDAELLRNINYVNHAGASAYLKKSFDKLKGYDPSIKIGTDYEMWLRAQEQGFKFCGTDVVLATYTKHKNQMTKVSVDERHRWLKLIRQKHDIYKVNMSYIKQKATPEVYNHFVNDPRLHEIWFEINSFPQR